MDNRTFSKIWIIFIALVLIAGGILAWQYFLVPKEEIKTFEAETSGWKTYGNKEYGFEIKYPANWNISGGVDMPGKAYLGEFTIRNYDTSESRINQMYFRIIILDNMELRSAIWFAENDLSLNPKLIIKEININGSLAVQTSACSDSDRSTCFPNIYIAYNENPKAMFYISGGVFNPKLEDNLNIFDQILSTFRFIKIKDETADWKTYKNEEYGFEIKYPLFLESSELGCRISEIEDIIFIGPVSLMFFDAQGLTLNEWINRKISESEEETKEIQENFKQAGYENWQEFGSKLLSREEIFVGGERAIKLSHQFIGASFDLPVTISVKNGDRIYDFHTNDANLVQEECAAKFDKTPSEAIELMLSTFRFLE